MASFNSFDNFVTWVKTIKKAPPPPYPRPQIHHGKINSGLVGPRALLPNGYNVRYNYMPHTREKVTRVWGSAPGGAYFLRHQPPRPAASEDTSSSIKRITVYNVPGCRRTGGRPFSSIRELSQWQREQWQITEEEDRLPSEFRSDGMDYDDEGYNSFGYDMFGGKKSGRNERGYDKRGYDRKGYNYFGFNKHGYSRHDYGEDGFNEKGYDSEGYDHQGYNIVGLPCTEYDAEGYDAYGLDCYGFDRDGYNGYGAKLEDYDENGLDQFGSNCYGYFKAGLEFPGASEKDEDEEEEEEKKKKKKKNGGGDPAHYKHEISPTAPASLPSDRAVLAVAREMASLGIAKAEAQIRGQQQHIT